MVDNDNTAPAEPAPAQFEVERADAYGQFMLRSRSEILAVLRTMIQKGALITVHFDRGNAFLLTAVVALVNDNQQFVLDLGSNDEMNRRALKADKLILTTTLDKVKVQFSVGGLTPTTHEGRASFLASLPATLLRLQRREFYRLSMPVANPVKLRATIQLADGSARDVEFPLLDISGGGVGLMCTPPEADLLQRGDTLSDGRINLPEEGILITQLTVRNKFDVTTRTGSRYVRVGCEYLDLPPARLTLVHRYITRIERERKARLSGMA